MAVLRGKRRVFHGLRNQPSCSYSKRVGADFVAWIRVQKVSNLILNMNVYIADVKAGRTVLTKSVDLRGNTDARGPRRKTY